MVPPDALPDIPTLPLHNRVGSRQWKQIRATKSDTDSNIPQNVLSPGARYGHTATSFGRDSILIFGGIADGHAYRDDLWTFYIGITLTFS